MRLLVLLTAFGFAGVAFAQDCPEPGVLWVEPDRGNVQMGTNLRMLVAVTDTAPGGEVDGLVTNDETRERHTMTWEVIQRDNGLPPGAEPSATVVHQALHIGSISPDLAPDALYTFTYRFTRADGSPGGEGEQAIWSAEGPDEAGPAINGRFAVEVTEVPAADSCAFGVPEVRFEFAAGDLHADGGDAAALQATLFQVTVPDTAGVALYDTGYYTGLTWSAVAARFEGRPDVCFAVGATDLYGNRTNYTNDYCVVMPGYEPPDAGPEPEGGPDGDGGEFDPDGCTCRATPGLRHGSRAYSFSALLALGLAVVLALGRPRS